MPDETLWLCVDPDGTEKASNTRPERLSEAIRKRTLESYIQEHPIPDSEERWIDDVSSTDYGYYGYEYGWFGVYLPHGTIEWLIGRRLTYQDDPAEFKVL